MQRIGLLVQKRLGDALFHTPALRWLRTHCPHAHIEVLAPSALAEEVFARNPHCDAVIPASEPESLESCHYDVVLGVFRNELSEAIVERVTNDARLQLRPDETTHRARGVLDHVSREIAGSPDTGASLAYEFFPSEADRERANHLLNPRSGPRIGVHVGCHGMAKRNFFSLGRKTHSKVWPGRTYRRFIRLVHQRWPDAQVVLTGSGSEARYARRLRGAGVLDLAGRTSVGELAAVIEDCDVYLTPDTGSLHLACTTTTPFVALFGPTDPAIYGPYPGHDAHETIRADSVTDIDPGRAVDAFARLLSGSAQQPVEARA